MASRVPHRRGAVSVLIWIRLTITKGRSVEQGRVRGRPRKPLSEAKRRPWRPDTPRVEPEEPQGAAPGRAGLGAGDDDEDDGAVGARSSFAPGLSRSAPSAPAGRVVTWNHSLVQTNTQYAVTATVPTATGQRARNVHGHAASAATWLNPTRAARITSRFHASKITNQRRLRMRQGANGRQASSARPAACVACQ